MPYRRPEDRLAAKRRYNASAKGKATARRYYELTRQKPRPINPHPLAAVVSTWN